MITSLLIQIVRGTSEKHFILLALGTFKLPQDLIIPLSAHHDLTVNILNIHVLSTIRISPHQASLISDPSLNIIDSSRRCGLLKTGSRGMCIGRLLNRIYRRCVLVYRSGLLMLIIVRLLLVYQLLLRFTLL